MIRFNRAFARLGPSAVRSRLRFASLAPSHPRIHRSRAIDERARRPRRSPWNPAPAIPHTHCAPRDLPPSSESPRDIHLVLSRPIQGPVPWGADPSPACATGEGLRIECRPPSKVVLGLHSAGGVVEAVENRVLVPLVSDQRRHLLDDAQFHRFVRGRGQD